MITRRIEDNKKTGQVTPDPKGIVIYLNDRKVADIPEADFRVVVRRKALKARSDLFEAVEEVHSRLQTRS